MKHIKTFEELTKHEKYTLGKDGYVSLSDSALRYMELYPIVKILKKIYYRIDKEYYQIEGIDSTNDKIRMVSLSEDELGRLATQQEIEEYEIRKSANKYNL